MCTSTQKNLPLPYVPKSPNNDDVSTDGSVVEVVVSTGVAVAATVGVSSQMPKGSFVAGGTVPDVDSLAATGTRDSTCATAGVSGLLSSSAAALCSLCFWCVLAFVGGAGCAGFDFWDVGGACSVAFWATFFVVRGWVCFCDFWAGFCVAVAGFCVIARGCSVGGCSVGCCSVGGFNKYGGKEVSV